MDDKAKIAQLEKELAEYKEKLQAVEASVRDEYLHTGDWMTEALKKLVYFAAIEFQPATLEHFPQKAVNFIDDKFFGYAYAGFYYFNIKNQSWNLLSEKGKKTVDVSTIPEFKGSAVFEEEYEVFNFFDINKKSYMMVVSLVGTDKKFSATDYSFLQLYFSLMISFFSMKILDREMQDTIVENSNMRNSARIINGIKEDRSTLEDSFIEIVQSLNIEAFVFARKMQAKEGLKIVLSNGIRIRSWDAFLKIIHENEDYVGHDWYILPVMDENLIVYGVAAFKMSTNANIRGIQERVLETIVPQISTVLSQKKFHKDSITDVLTGAYNRRFIMKMLDERYKRAEIDEDYNLSAAMIDIDYFKSVNDNYGHQAGDEVLRKIVDVLLKTLREVDLIGRYGGEEFLIIISAEKRIALRVCERIRKAVEVLKIEWESKEIWVTVSIGVASYSDGPKTVDEIIAMSDLALYEAKGQGRNRVIEYKMRD